jgi:LCP family protein required for cell wall assembly
MPGLGAPPVVYTPTPGDGQAGGDSQGEVPTPIPLQSDVQLEEWDGSSRVNVLIMGLDYNDYRAGTGPPRTDTMILFTIDPQTSTAGMLSIPRDMWVNIPGFGHGRINTAYQLGEGNRLPGGGPGLAVKTVEQFLGVTIHFFAQVDFEAFVYLVDEIGGVKIEVTEPIRIVVIDKPVPVDVEPGVYRMDGETALAYARARYTAGGDFDRAERQQQVIFAFREQILYPPTLQHFLTNGPAIFNHISNRIDTNMTYDQILRLALLAKQVDVKNIQTGVIAPPEQVTLEMSPDGQQVLKPVPDKIRLLRDEIFTTSTVTSPAILGKDISELVVEEAAMIAVFNGAGVSGLAAETQEYLNGLGLNVTEIGTEDIIPNTKIIDYTGNPYTVKYVVDLMNIQPQKIFNRYDPNSSVDIAIVVGGDWSISN